MYFSTLRNIVRPLLTMSCLDELGTLEGTLMLVLTL
jgi:hypothetical protein